MPDFSPSEMKVWAIVYNPGAFSGELYQHALLALDYESVNRIRKFYRREDACRCLIGRILRCMLLHKRGVDPRTANFATTEAGKPYIAYPTLQPPIAYNVAHDNALVVISFSPNARNPPAYSLGIDVMKVHLHGHDTFAMFIETMTEALTPLELHQLTGGKSDDENLRRFFWMWTMKEAYTKAVGLGLGFNFRRVEYDAEANTLRIDGTRPRGWQFNKFTVQVCEDVYQGVIAQYVGGDELDITEESTELPKYMEVYDAVSFIEDALLQLNH